MKDLPILYIKRHELDQMSEYSTSLPTGTAIGKRWKRNINMLAGPHGFAVEGEGPPIWRVGEYVPHLDPDLVGIKWWRPITT